MIRRNAITACAWGTATSVIARMKRKKTMARYIDAGVTLETLKEFLIKTAINNVGLKRDVDKVCKDIADNRLSVWMEYVPTADVVSKEKYDELHERYHRLLESAKILSDAVREYERREDGEIH